MQAFFYEPSLKIALGRHLDAIKNGLGKGGIEKIIFNQLYNYLTECNPLADSQHGFRPMHSTLTALLEATNDWYLNIDNGLLNGVLFLDLKKAFDTLDHYILLEKLKLYGVDTPSLSWFTSYLLNCKQLTCKWFSFKRTVNSLWSSTGVCAWASVIFNLHLISKPALSHPMPGCMRMIHALRPLQLTLKCYSLS